MGIAKYHMTRSMTMDLHGKNVLVTGGGSGIGLAIAEAMANEGCKV
jgi:NAD(P)-dependent dehydrogenase (short-subunit alcohol dehydrogenase family)